MLGQIAPWFPVWTKQGHLGKIDLNYFCLLCPIWAKTFQKTIMVFGCITLGKIGPKLPVCRNRGFLGKLTVSFAYLLCPFMLQSFKIIPGVHHEIYFLILGQFGHKLLFGPKSRFFGKLKLTPAVSHHTTTFEVALYWVNLGPNCPFSPKKKFSEIFKYYFCLHVAPPSCHILKKSESPSLHIRLF